MLTKQMFIDIKRMMAVTASAKVAHKAAEDAVNEQFLARVKEATRLVATEIHQAAFGGHFGCDITLDDLGGTLTQEVRSLICGHLEAKKYCVQKVGTFKLSVSW